MRVAICDDDEGVCSELEKWILEFSANEKIGMDVQIYNNAEPIMEECGEEKWFDIMFIDIELPKKTGIELAHFVREYYGGCYTPIIFISGKTEYCLDLFELEPLNFYAKPMKKEKVFHDLQKVIQRSQEQRQVIKYKEDGIKKGILLRDIAYFEASNKMVAIVSKTGKRIVIRDTLEDIYEKYKGYNFCRCHRSYLINLSYVEKYYKNMLFMRTGDKIVVSKTYQKELQDEWIQYDWEE